MGAMVSSSQPSVSVSANVSVTLPELSRSAQAGQEHFQANCAACHGDDGGGTNQGPPLIHKIYETGHHSDGAFFLALQRGVRQHHRTFCDMPAQRQVTRGQAMLIAKQPQSSKVCFTTLTGTSVDLGNFHWTEELSLAIKGHASGSLIFFAARKIENPSMATPRKPNSCPSKGKNAMSPVAPTNERMGPTTNVPHAAHPIPRKPLATPPTPARAAACPICLLKRLRNFT
jgi:cytochrome c2